MKFLGSIFIIVAVFMNAPANADGVKEQPCVGYASIDRDEVIHLNLVSSEATHGGAMLILEKTHPLYDEMRKHIGKVKTGHWKCLKSMPELEPADEPKKDLQAPVPKR